MLDIENNCKKENNYQNFNNKKAHFSKVSLPNYFKGLGHSDDSEKRVEIKNYVLILFWNP